MAISIAAHAHSLTTSTCSGKIGPGDAQVQINVAPSGQISGTAGGSNTGEMRPFTAQEQPNGTVNIIRADGTVWYSDATMREGWFLATYHRPPARGGGQFMAQLRCNR